MPLCFDQCTLGKKRMVNARLIVEIYVSEDLLKNVHMQRVNDEVFSFEFKWVPSFCIKGNKHGNLHNAAQKPRVMQKVVLKGIVTPKLVEEQKQKDSTYLKHISWTMATR